MKRTRIEPADVAARDNLARAAHQAARGKRGRPEVRAFFDRFDERLEGLGASIRAGSMPAGGYRAFVIHDPKRRVIHAASFEDRVFHHALMNLAGPVLDRALTSATYACRPGMGHHAAVRRVQEHLQRYPWYVLIDIDAYFDSIDQALLLGLLERRFKGKGLLDTIARILQSYQTRPGRGLPIGALTSQHFANYYLDGLDRLLQERLTTRAYVRYMDDCIWWCDTRDEAMATLSRVCAYLADERRLLVKDHPRINRSSHGVTFCGYRILPGAIRLSPRKRQRYRQRRRFWEDAYRLGIIDSLQLQRAYAAVHAITDHADSVSWRRENLRRHPAMEV